MTGSTASLAARQHQCQNQTRGQQMGSIQVPYLQRCYAKGKKYGYYRHFGRDDSSAIRAAGRSPRHPEHAPGNPSSITVLTR
jgi:hypothetical protein